MRSFRGLRNNVSGYLSKSAVKSQLALRSDFFVTMDPSWYVKLWNQSSTHCSSHRWFPQLTTIDISNIEHQPFDRESNASSHQGLKLDTLKINTVVDQGKDENLLLARSSNGGFTRPQTKLIVALVIFAAIEDAWQIRGKLSLHRPVLPATIIIYWPASQKF